MMVQQKFEARWLEEEDCMNRVKEAWISALQIGEVNMMELQKKKYSLICGGGTGKFWENWRRE
jgi:hypothetical protein